MLTEVECNRRGCLHSNETEAITSHLSWPHGMVVCVIRITDFKTGKIVVKSDEQFRLLVNAATEAHKVEGRVLVGYHKDPTRLAMFFTEKVKAEDARKWWAEMKKITDGLK